MSKKKDTEPAVPQQPVVGGNVDDAEGIETMQIKAPYIVAATLTVMYSNGEGETMHAVARDDNGLLIQIGNNIKVGR